MVKNPPAVQEMQRPGFDPWIGKIPWRRAWQPTPVFLPGDLREVDSNPKWGRSPRGGHGNPLQYSYLENPMNRGAWRAIVCGIAESQT